VRFDYLAFDLSAAGWAGAAAWLLLAIGAAVAVARRDDRARFAQPVTLFALAWLGLFFAISNLYHVYPIDPAGGPNDVFLFAPNLVFPVVLLVAAAYAHGIVSAAPRARLLARLALAVAVLASGANTGMHIRDLFALYA
jgi:hypothetical protein